MSEQIRLGIIVPSVNSVVEAWYPKAVPDGVSVHFARMLMPAGTSPERIIEMDRTDGKHAIDQLTSCRPHAIAYGCTASSIVQGHQFDAHLREEVLGPVLPVVTPTDLSFGSFTPLIPELALTINACPSFT